MALTREARPAAGAMDEARDAGDGGFWGRPWVVLAVVAALLIALSWGFIVDPTITAPTRDPAWYTWRANVAIADSPEQIVRDWGPFSAFSGGYRVTVPLLGAILNGVADIGTYQFSAFMMIGMPVLAGLAMGAFGYRSRRDPLLLLLTLLAAAALFLTTPYLGYLDNITMLYIIALLLAFVPQAQTSWGARTACFLFAFVSAFTHPTTCVLVGLSLLGVFGWRVLTARFHLADALKRHGPALMATGFGMLLGLALWFTPLWGRSAPLADAALPPPYDREFFNDRLLDWVLSMKPLITFTLAALAIAATIWTARRRREPADTYSMTSIWYLFPYVGVLGALTSAALPYYRFMNSTTAIMILSGLGAWVAVRWLSRRTGGARVPGLIGALVVVAALVYVFAVGWRSWVQPNNQWIDQDTRVALASVTEVVEREPDAPVVFLENYGDDQVAYGWAKTFTNVARTGIPGDAVARSAAYFGTLENFLAGEPTTFRNDPIPTVEKYRDSGLSEGYLDEMNEVLARFDAPPLVFAVREFNKGENAELFPSGCLADEGSPAGDAVVPIGCDVALISAPGTTTTPSTEVVEAAIRAGDAQRRAFAEGGGLFGDPLHLLRVVLGLGLLIVVPGLLAARWFEVDGFLARLSLVPGLSLGLVLVSGIAVAAVWRGPFDAAHAWASAGLAVAIGAGLGLGRAALSRALTRFGDFFNSMFSSFSNADFATLMAVQFLVLAADGVVRGSIAKSIAFGGQKGFDITTVPSADYLLKVALALYVPYSVVSPFIGVFIDRFERRRVLWASSIITAVVVAVIAGSVLLPLGGETSEGNVAATAALVVAMLVMQACVRVALAVKSAALPQVLSGRDLLQGNGLSQAGGALFQVLGAGVAFGAGAAAPAWAVVAFGSGILVVSAFIALGINRMEVTRHAATFREEVRRVVRDIAAGLREVASRPPAALALSGFQMLRYHFWGFTLGMFALYARSLVASGDVDTIALGLVGGGGFLGGAIGLVLAQTWKDRIAPVRLLLASMALLGASSIVFGIWVGLAGFAALLFCGFFGFFIGKISADTIVQQVMPDDFRGRAFALFDIAYNLGFIVPAFILFLVWADDRVRLILVASGAVFLALTAALAVWARRIGDRFAPQDDVPGERAAAGRA